MSNVPLIYIHFSTTFNYIFYPEIRCSNYTHRVWDVASTILSLLWWLERNFPNNFLKFYFNIQSLWERVLFTISLFCQIFNRKPYKVSAIDVMIQKKVRWLISSELKEVRSGPVRGTFWPLYAQQPTAWLVPSFSSSSADFVPGLNLREWLKIQNLDFPFGPSPINSWPSPAPQPPQLTCRGRKV